MFIRFEDTLGCGIYQGDLNYSDSKFGGIFDFLGTVTRAPTEYRGMVKDVPCRGVDYQFTKFLKPGNKFAWKYDFFLRVSNGNLHKHEVDVLQRVDWGVKFLNTDQIRKKFVKACFGDNISILLIDGPVLAESDQQVIYDVDEVEMVSRINENDLSVLSETFYKLKTDIESFNL